VFGSVEVSGAADVLRNWDQIKTAEPGRGNGVFGDVPENLPALLYARKVQRRAGSAGIEFDEAANPLGVARARLDGLPEIEDRDERFRAVGDALFALVAAARALHVDPELALRDAAARFRQRLGDHDDKGDEAVE
jgi:ATP diphosphatase